MLYETLKELIETGEIGFYKKDKQLFVAPRKCDAQSERVWSELNVSEAEKYVWRSGRSLAKQAREYVSIRGLGLEDFLAKEKNLHVFADFVLDIHVGAKYPVKVHVETDIDVLAQKYVGEKESSLVNLFGTVRIDISKWFKGGSVFERDWNLALCDAWGGFVGYPGYEWPRTAKQFEDHCAHHAQAIMIGTKEQLSRYARWAKKSPGYLDEIEKMLSIFQRYGEGV